MFDEEIVALYLGTVYHPEKGGALVIQSSLFHRIPLLTEKSDNLLERRSVWAELSRDRLGSRWLTCFVEYISVNPSEDITCFGFRKVYSIDFIKQNCLRENSVSLNNSGPGA